MIRLLHPEIASILHGIYYRFRFLGIYIVIGFFSLLLELAVRSQLLLIGVHNYFATGLSLAISIILAFIGNAFFNFRIPPTRRNRAFFYFVTISLLSGIIQWFVLQALQSEVWNYEQGRLVISGCMFMIAYLLHRRFSFRDFKRVGVAIYANGVEDLSGIFDSIGQYPDFIHVDIVDSSFTSNPVEIKTYRMETIKAFWSNLEIHTHIMSKTPSKWMSEVLPYSDTIFIHWECDEKIDEIIKFLHKQGKKVGLALTMNTILDQALTELENVDAILLLTIPEPGKSGQTFDMVGLDFIKKLNSLTFRDKFRICVDGGVNGEIVPLLQVEDVVSGSSVLNHPQPKRQILRLQTSGRYESI